MRLAGKGSLLGERKGWPRDQVRRHLKLQLQQLHPQLNLLRHPRNPRSDRDLP
ncbi:hypothetical protein RHMOL_Rhmol07G0123900 [Rhododendron molle]|uniref:Uncharacterized protein n=1 Tax=Rhododendron molle TaxID=49168 RepID=A0ACC0N012_RHOML|nr:hypothetical protein RHMOL_Rhmol07G0123900 [Rhododendron molle]